MTDEREPYTRVTIGDVYREVRQLRDELHTVLATTAMNAANIADHETRLRRVEAWKNAIPPALLMAVGSLLVALLT